MAAQIGSLYVSLTANVQPYAQSLNKAEAVTNASLSKIRSSMGVTGRAVDSFWGSISSQKIRPYSLIAVSRAFDNLGDRAGLLRGSLIALTGAFGGFSAALAGNLILRYADSFTSLSNQMRVVSDNSEDAAARLRAVEDLARRSRSSLQATALLYTRLQKAAPDRSADQVLRYVETIQKALQIGGATTEEARSAAIQFSQAIASNRLSGDEIRAVLETPLGLELAKGLGVTIGKLRQMGQQGLLTSDQVLKGLDAIANDVDSKFARTIGTLDQSFVQLDNSFTDFIGNVNQSLGGTRTLAKIILDLADNLDKVVPALAAVGTVLASTFLARNKGILGGLVGAGIGGIAGGAIAGPGGAAIGALAGGALTGQLGARFDAVRKARQEMTEQQRLEQGLVSLSERWNAAKRNLDEVTGKVKSLERAYYDAKLAANQARRAAEADPLKFADTNTVKELERGLTTLQKLDEAKLKQQEKIRRSYQDLAAVEAALTPQTRKLVDSQIEGEAKLLEIQQKRANLVSLLGKAQAQASTAALLAAGSAVVTPGRNTGPLTKGSDRTVASLQTLITASQDQEIKQAEANAQRQARIDQQLTEAEKKAAAERIAIRQRLSEEQARLDQVDQARSIAVADQRVNRSAAVKSGTEAQRDAVLGAARAERELGSALAGARGELEAAAKSATLAGQAKAFLGRQVSSIVGLFGGPWGLAITAGLTGLAFLGERAQEAAAKAENLRQKVNELVGEQAKLGDGVATKSVTSLNLDEFRATLDEIQQSRSQISASLDSHGLVRLDPAIEQIKALEQQLYDGQISAERFRVKLGQIERPSGVGRFFDDLINGAVSASNQIERLGIAARVTQGKIVDLIRQSSGGKSLFRQSQEAGLVDLNPLAFKAQRAGLPDQQTADNAAQAADKVTRALNAQLVAAQMNADGMTLEAKAVQFVAEQQKSGVTISYDYVLSVLKQIDAAERAAKSFSSLGNAMNVLRFQAEHSSMQAFEKYQYEAKAATDELIRSINQNIEVTNRKARGDNDGARALEIYNQQAKAGTPITYDLALSLAQAEGAAERAAKAFSTAGDALRTLRFEAEHASDKALEAFQFENQASVDAAIRGLKEQIQVGRLRAQGLDEEAAAQEKINQLREQGVIVTPEQEKQIRSLAAEAFATDKLAASMKKEETAAENLTKKLARMRAEATGAFLPSDIDRQVIQMAREAKVAASAIEEYVQAAKSGDFSSAPKQLVDLRTVLETEKAAEAAREVITEYGNWAQVAPLAKEKQDELNIAVQNGAITASQAQQAYEDFLGTLGSVRNVREATSFLASTLFQGVQDSIDQSQQAVTSLVSAIKNSKSLGDAQSAARDALANNVSADDKLAKAVLGAKNLDQAIKDANAHIKDAANPVNVLADAFGNLAKKVEEAALEAFILGTGPFAALLGVKSDSGGLLGFLFKALIPGAGGTSTPSFTGGVGVSGTTTGTLYHSGGVVGPGGLTRQVPTSLFVGAPRYHSGVHLRPGERPAILQDGETVFPRWARGISGGGDVKINIYNQTGARVSAEKGTDANGGQTINIRVVDDMMAGVIADRSSKTNRGLRSQFGLRGRTTNRGQ